MFSGNTSQVSDDKLFVEDVFSTYLYTGNNGTQTITNGIDLAGKGGMTWTKQRTGTGAGNHHLFDSMRGSFALQSNTTTAQFAGYTYTQLATGFSVNGADINGSSRTYASWTFREAPKFFDVVTYTGNGGDLTINHSLGVQPGCIIIKKYSASGDWLVSHRYNFGGAMLKLNTTDAAFSAGIIATATTFRVFGGIAGNSDSGATYVAYLFAHDATSDGVIQCGSYTGTDANLSVTLGFEPQWILIKSASLSGATYGGWHIVDNMRGLNDTLSSTSPPYLKANTSAVEATGNPNGIAITSTGFRVNSSWSVAPETYIYIAIRRGPMKTPTLGTSVFSPIARTGTSANTTVAGPTSGASDLVMVRPRLNASTTSFAFADRLRSNLYMTSDTNFNQTSNSASFQSNPWDVMSGVKLGSGGASSSLVQTNGSSYNYINYLLRRAPGFFDETCYTGTGVASTVSHNLGVAPELVIVKSRSLYADWQVYSASLANTEYLVLNSTAAKATGTTRWNSTTPTATDFTVGTDITVNSSGATYVAYLFASCPGVSKVGSYTGTGTTQTIDCGFAAGARFVLIKRTNSTGDWYVWDTARGIVSGNDPHLSLNAQAGEVTTDDTIDTDSSGFVVNQVAATNVNVSSATYIYLAIA